MYLQSLLLIYSLSLISAKTSSVISLNFVDHSMELHSNLDTFYAFHGNCSYLFFSQIMSSFFKNHLVKND